MRKVERYDCPPPGNGTKKGSFLMRAGRLVLLLCAFQTGVPVLYAQGETVALPGRTLSVEEVFGTIRKQLGYDIFYSNEEVDVTRRVALSSSSLSVGQALRETLGENYTCEFSGRTIVIRPGSQARGPAAAEITVRGVVRGPGGEPVAGATVMLKGTRRGVATDIQGRFSITVPRGDNVVLEVSCVGMETREVHYRGQENVMVTLTPVEKKIEDVVVTGYQVIEKRQASSAVATVKVADIPIIGAGSVENMLQGQVAGLSVVNTMAAPGAAPKIRVRGTATITGNADPLWVLDGMMLENSIPVTAAELNSPDVMNMFNTAIGGISPSDIESITVLKDASATAIYGTRAANGVIVVTTRKGRRNGFNLSAQYTASVSTRPTYERFNVLNSQETVALVQQNYDDGMWIRGSASMNFLIQEYALGNLSLADYKTQVSRLETMNTDWLKLLYRNAFTQTLNFSMSGGSENADYYVSANYDDEQGQDKLSGYKNFGGLAKVNAEPFRGVKLGALLQAGRRDRDMYHQSINPFEYAISTVRTLPVHNDDGTLFMYPRSYGYLFNILSEQQQTKRYSSQTDLKAIANLSINIYKGLKYSGLYSYAASFSTGVNYAKEKSAYAAAIRGYNYGNPTTEELEETKMPFGGVYNQTSYEQRTSLIRNALEYKGTICNVVELEAQLGQEFRTTNYTGLTTGAYGYLHDRGNIFYNPAETEAEGHLYRNMVMRNLPKRSWVSYYGILSVMFKERYIVNGNVRFDGSNLFGSNPKYRYLPLWSASAKWIMSGEPFLAGAEWLDNLALRASYGLRGNIVDESTPQIIAQALPPNSINRLLELGIIQPPNPNLKWETTASVNFGFELSVLDGRLNFDMNVYRDYSRDLIAMKDVSSVTGFQRKAVNYADVKNRGLEIALSGYIVRNKAWSWLSSLNLAYVKNEVVKSYITPQAQRLVRSIYTPGEVYLGKPVNGMFSYDFARLGEDGFPLFNYRDADNLPIVIGANDKTAVSAFLNDIDALIYEGARDPVYTGGLNNVVRYKNLTFSFLFAFGLDNVVRLPTVAYSTSPTFEKNSNRSIMKRWRKPGDEKHTTIPSLSSGGSGFTGADGNTYYTTRLYNQSQMTSVPGDYLRFRNLMLEYRLPQRLTGKAVIGGRQLGGISLKFQAQNIWVLADKRLGGYDPETINYTTTDYGSLPLPTTFTFGFNVNF